MDFARGFEPSVGKGAGSSKGGTVVPIELDGWTTIERKIVNVLELEAKAADQMAALFRALTSPALRYAEFERVDVMGLDELHLRLIPLETDLRYLQQPSSEGNDDKGLFISLWYGAGIRLSAMFDLYQGQTTIRSFRLNWRFRNKPRELTVPTMDCAMILSLTEKVRAVHVVRLIKQNTRTGTRPD